LIQSAQNNLRSIKNIESINGNACLGVMKMVIKMMNKVLRRFIGVVLRGVRKGDEKMVFVYFNQMI
jgi:hypothetical protein